MIRDCQVVHYLPSDTIARPVQSVFGDSLHENWIYIGTTGAEILHGCLTEPAETYEMIETEGLLNICAIRQVGDRLWLSSDGGVGFIEPDGVFRKLADPAFNSMVNMYVDYEGNLWFASSRNGLIRISESNFADRSSTSTNPSGRFSTWWASLRLST